MLENWFVKFLLKKTVFLVVLILVYVFSAVGFVQAQSNEPTDTFLSAKVLKILEEGQLDIDGQKQDFQKIEVEILSGDKKGEIVNIDHGSSFAISPYQKVKVGEKVVLDHPAETIGAKKDFYYILDKYRLDALSYLAAIFFGLAVFFGRKRGLMAIFGMLFSVLVIFYFIIPKILSGSDPLTVAVVGGVVIIFVSLYLSHGFNRRSTIALVSTLLALALAVLLDLFFVHFSSLSGAGTEEAFYLQLDNFSINTKSLLLAGIIIGVLGVLDDVTTALAASVEELHFANNKLGFSGLYKSGLSIGREHIASLINTLVLAYVGASFPLLLLFSMNKGQPLWVTINSNFIAEEIVRTLVGSSVLILAVPITTFLSAWYYSRLKS